MIRIPERICVACRRKRPRTELCRVVRTPQGEVKLDNEYRRQGRGAYVCREAPCLLQATRKGGLARALRTRIPQDVIEDVPGQGHQNTPGEATHG